MILQIVGLCQALNDILDSMAKKGLPIPVWSMLLAIVLEIKDLLTHINNLAFCFVINFVKITHFVIRILHARTWSQQAWRLFIFSVLIVFTPAFILRQKMAEKYLFLFTWLQNQRLVNMPFQFSDCNLLVIMPFRFWIVICQALPASFTPVN